MLLIYLQNDHYLYFDVDNKTCPIVRSVSNTNIDVMLSNNSIDQHKAYKEDEKAIEDIITTSRFKREEPFNGRLYEWKDNLDELLQAPEGSLYCC